MIDEMNILIQIPDDTAIIRCNAKFVDDEGEQEASAVWSPADIHEGFKNYYAMNEGYFADHIGMKDAYPIIMTIPETAYAAELTFYRIKSGGEAEDTVARLKRSQIKGLREDFLKYIPDGDDYDALYVAAGGDHEET